MNIKEVKQTIKDLTEKIDGLKDAVRETELEISGIEGQIEDLEDEKSTLEECKTDTLNDIKQAEEEKARAEGNYKALKLGMIVLSDEERKNNMTIFDVIS